MNNIKIKNNPNSKNNNYYRLYLSKISFLLSCLPKLGILIISRMIGDLVQAKAYSFYNNKALRCAPKSGSHRFNLPKRNLSVINNNKR